jgi:Zn-dependent protease
LEEGIPLVAAAHNDLGVLAAQRGEFGDARAHFIQAIATDADYDLATWNLGVLESRQSGPILVAGQGLLATAAELNRDLLTKPLTFLADERVYRLDVSGTDLELARAPGTGAAVGAAAFGAIATVGAFAQLISGIGGDMQEAAETVSTQGLGRATRRLRSLAGRLPLPDRAWPSWAAWIPAIVVLIVTTAWTASWMAPDAFVTAVLLGLAAAGVALVVHTCGHLVVAGRFGAKLEASGWTPGLALAVVGMPFHVPAGPFLAEHITTGDERRDWWVSFAGVFANLAAAAVALLIYLWAPMPFLRILVATHLAVAAFALIPSHPLDGERLSTQPIVLALLGLGVAAAATAIAVGAI